jgi:hypothetical protein
MRPRACFYCGGKLVDAEPLDVWEVHSGERFAKVNCANEKCHSMAWRPEQAKPQKKPERDCPQASVTQFVLCLCHSAIYYLPYVPELVQTDLSGWIVAYSSTKTIPLVQVLSSRSSHSIVVVCSGDTGFSRRRSSAALSPRCAPTG